MIFLKLKNAFLVHKHFAFNVFLRHEYILKTVDQLFHFVLPCMYLLRVELFSCSTIFLYVFAYHVEYFSRKLMHLLIFIT